METRRAVRFERRAKVSAFLLFVGSFLALVATIRYLHSVLALFAVFFLCAAVMVTVMIRSFTRFTCPQCGLLLPRPVNTGNKENVPIKYPCPHCNVVWNTGLRTSSD